MMDFFRNVAKWFRIGLRQKKFDAVITTLQSEKDRLQTTKDNLTRAIDHLSGQVGEAHDLHGKVSGILKTLGHD